MIFSDLLNYYEEQNRASLSPNTLRTYKTQLNLFYRFCKKPIEEWTTTDVRTYLLYKENKNPRIIIFSIQSFYNFAKEEGWIDSNAHLHLDIPPPRKIPIYYLTKEQLNLFRKTVEGDLVVQVMVELLYCTGIRISELCNLKVEHINWEERSILIYESKANEQRLVLFTRDCERLLVQYLELSGRKKGWLFSRYSKTSPISPRTVEKWIEAYSEKIGIYCTPHTFRHTFAAHLAQKGMPLVHIQALMGHESYKHTALYARLYEEARKEIYDYYCD